MDARRIAPLVAAGTTLAAVLGPTVPAAAAVRYDPRAKTGVVGAADVRRAFGWTAATLAARAPGLTFGHAFWTTDTYTVRCGGKPFRVEHPREFGRYELTAVVVRETRREGATGYGALPAPTGFRLTGPHTGISGTSVAPAAGQPCPRPRGRTITRADRLSTATGWSLTVDSGVLSKVLTTRTALN